jgi:hypothetical protein
MSVTACYLRTLCQVLKSTIFKDITYYFLE